MNMSKSAHVALILAASCIAERHGNAQVGEAKVVASNGMPSDGFGGRVDLDGDWAVISAIGIDSPVPGAGAAYFFQRGATGWQETQLFQAPDVESSWQVGASAKMSGSTCAIGAIGARTGPGGARTGAVYVLERTGSTWSQTQKVLPSPALGIEQFGYALDVEGSVLAVGSPFASTMGLDSGDAFVFERAGGAFAQVAHLTPSDIFDGAYFGLSLDLSGDWLAVGALYGGQVAYRPGCVYMFHRSGNGLWTQTQKLLGSGVQNAGNFGAALALDGDALLVRSKSPVTGYEQIHTFARNGMTWSETGFLTPSDAPQNHDFSVSYMRNGTAICGDATINDEQPVAGCAYVYRQIGGVWNQVARIVASDGQTDDYFGISGAISGNTVLIGAVGDDDACSSLPICNSGAIYFYDVNVDAIQYGSCATNAPCANSDKHGGCRNSTGHGAVLQAGGTGSVAADDLRLETRTLPPGTPTLLYMGSTQISVPFGSGQRVVGGGSTGVFRLGVQFADAPGTVMRGPGLVAQSVGLGGAGVIAPGSVWNFQCWYRDTATPCTLPFNLSNGVQVTFRP